MKIALKNQETRKFQVGGAMPAGESAGTPTEGGLAPVDLTTSDQNTEQDPIMMLAQMSSLAILTLDCLMAMLVCLAFLEIVSQMLGGAPELPLGEPVFRKGGTLVRRIKK